MTTNIKEVTQNSMWQEFGALALGSRLRKLSDQLFHQVEDLYSQQQIAISPRYFPLLIQLSQQEPLCVSEIADRLGVSHAAVVQTLNLMKRDDLVVDHESPTDSRRSDLYLSTKGKQLVKRLEPIWMQLWKIINQMLQDHAPVLLTQLEEFEGALAQKTLTERFLQGEQSGVQAVELLEWNPRYHAAFTDLNEEWLKSYFSIEKEDRKLLDYPEREIIGRGGMIFFARQRGLIAGTCALISLDNDTFELAKMAVAPDLRRHGIGRALLEYAIMWAKQRGARRISLESSSKLGPALKLYSSFGFIHKNPAHASAFKRADVYMELSLDK